MAEVQEPTLVQTLRAHRSEVTCADAAGAWLASGGGDRALRVWRWAPGAGWQERASAAHAHRYGVTAARWAGGAALLASGGVDGVARVWSRALAARRALAAPAAPAVRALCWAARGRLLAGHDDGALCVWHVPRAALLARLLAHEGALYAVAAPAAGALLLTACTHGVLKVFDLAEVCRGGSEGASPAPLTWVDGAHDMGALCADAAAGGALAATGGHDALVRVWARAGRGVRAAGTLEGHAAAVTALRWVGALLASGSLDRTARLWAPAAGACLHVLHAHPRYLTCVAVSHDLRYLVTGSNDKSVKMWSLGALTLDSDIEVPCAVLEHFGLGDLEGIGPVAEDALLEDAAPEGDGEVGGEEGGRVWLEQVHSGAVNCIAVYEDLIATASSDGSVRVFRWAGEALQALHTLDAHQYPATACDFGAGGALLLTAGLDARACLWDVQSGVQLRSLCVPGCGADGGEAGGGGVRGARVSPHRPPMLLLATDDGLAPLWSLASSDPNPDHVYSGHAEAVTCCAWARDGRVAATGAASGELRVLAPPPHAQLLHHDAHAHDLGVQSCDFAPPCAALALPEGGYMLATAGCDSLVKLWIVEYNEGVGSARVAQALAAHGGGAACVRWGADGALASTGADRWARVWRVAGGRARAGAAVAVPGAGGAPAAAFLPAARLLLAGTMAGELAAWRLAPGDEPDGSDDESTAPALWGPADVAHWLRLYVTRAPGSQVSREQEAELLRRVHDADVTGARLLSDPVGELLDLLGYGEESSEKSAATRARLAEEVEWLRREPPAPELASSAAHALLCPLTHRLLAEPARAADGYTYEREHILDWFLAADGAVSPVTGRRMRNAHVPPNYELRDQLRQFVREHTH